MRFFLGCYKVCNIYGRERIGNRRQCDFHRRDHHFQQRCIGQAIYCYSLHQEQSDSKQGKTIEISRSYLIIVFSGRHMISSDTIFWNDENVIRRPNKSANQRRNPLTIRTIQSVTWSRRQLLARQLMDQIFVSLYLLGGTLAISKICVLST